MLCKLYTRIKNLTFLFSHPNSSLIHLSELSSLSYLVGVRVNRRIRSIRNLELAVVIILALLANPLVLDSRERSAPIASRMAIGHWLRRPFPLRVEDTGVRGVEVAVLEIGRRVPGADLVACVLADVLEDVGADVPASERVEVPVCFYGGDFGVVVVVAGVGCAFE